MSAKDQIKQIVDYFKREPQLKDKTDGMAEGLLLGAQLADDANELSKETDASFKTLQREYTENGNGSQTTAEITVARDGELVLDDRLKRDFGNVNAQLAQKVGYLPSTQDAVGEWWIHPVSTYQESPYPRTVSGAIASNGSILAIEYNHATGKKMRKEVGKAVIDDHNVPSLWVKSRHRTVLAWTNHNNDNYLRFKIGAVNGDLGSLEHAKEYAVNVTQLTSYTQLYRIEHLSNSDQDTFLILFRRNNDVWSILKFRVYKITGAFTLVNMDTNEPTSSMESIGRSLLHAPGRQCYVSTADAYSEENQVIRLSWGYNPAQNVHSVYYIEMDLVTGNITTPFDNNLNANLYNSETLPIRDTSIQPMIKDIEQGYSRRLFYTRPGPDTPAVAFADWEIGKEDEAVYKVVNLSRIETVSGGLELNSGYASTPKTDSMEKSIGFEMKVVARFRETPVADAEMARRYLSSTDSSFTLRITPERKLKIGLTLAGGGLLTYVSSEKVPGSWKDKIGYGFAASQEDQKIYPLYSLDGTNWTRLTGIPFNYLSALYTGSTAPLVISTSSPALASEDPLVVYSARMNELNGTLIAGFDDFLSQWGGKGTSTDAAGRIWTLNSGAQISSTVVSSAVLTTNEFGLAGPRIGHTPESNYIAGMAFENPSYDGVVITAQSDNEMETIKKWRKGDSGYNPEIIYQHSTAKGRLVRPYVPINNGAVPLVVTNMTKYYSYNDYQGEQITT